MRRPLAFALCACMAVAGIVTPSNAQIVLTTGTGSSVTDVQGTANFESTSALNSPVYSEGGMDFSRSGLSYNNNGCGYAGCYPYWSNAGFTGNYMYGTGQNGYFDITTSGAGVFHGLEFLIGNGNGSSPMNVTWSAFLGGTLVGSGSTNLAWGTVVGFSGIGGFDALRYTQIQGQFGTAPAFDSVRAQFTSAVPEPATWAMMLFGFGAIGCSMRRRRQRSQPVVLPA